ncbi:TPA: BRO family protein [Haemophilus influenzae]
MTTQIQFSTFNFKNFPVRTITDPNSEIWFCGTDVCDILGYSNAPDALRKHCKPKGIAKRYTPTVGGEQEMIFISEPNLYRLTVKSRKPEAEPFEEWIFEEVLPQIRKTGKYEISQPALPMPEPTYSQSFSQQDIDNLVWLLFSHERMRFLLENLYKPLALLNSPFAPQVYGNVTEYKRVHKIAKPLIKKLLDKLQSDNPEKWRHLTRYLNNEIC